MNTKATHIMNKYDIHRLLKSVRLKTIVAQHI